MAGGCLILCVLIQVLLNTRAYGKVTANCPTQTGTEGGPLYLTCIVACDGCSSTNDYSWKKADNSGICKEKYRVITTGTSHTFNCTIEKTSMEDNGALTFWAQMTAGDVKTNFHVTIVPLPVNPTKRNYLADPDKNKPSEEIHDSPPNSLTAAVAIAVVSCFIIIIMVTFFLKRKINDNRTFSAPCTHRMITETDTP